MIETGYRYLDNEDGSYDVCYDHNQDSFFSALHRHHVATVKEDDELWYVNNNCGAGWGEYPKKDWTLEKAIYDQCIEDHISPTASRSSEKAMKENNLIPRAGRYLGSIAEVLMAISLCALAFSLFIWMFAIFSMSDTSGLQAFTYVLCSISGLVSSVVLLGFSYVVKAAIIYLDKNGEFGEK